MTDYFFMHKNRKLLAFSLEGNAVLASRVNEKEAAFLPVSYGSNIEKWLHSRSIPVTRKGLFSAVDKPDVFQLLIYNLALSLTDAYWICPVGSIHTWESVNLYTNDFKDNVSLDLTDNRTGGTGFLPSISLQGDLEKKWLIDESGTRMLVKGNDSDTCIQSLCEVLAAKIYETQPHKIAFAQYSLVKIKTGDKEIIGCKCPNFTNESLEFIPAIDIVNSSKCPNHMNYFQFYLQILEEHGLMCRDFYDIQIMTDFIITNVDRHFYNFGVLRDSNTLEYQKPAPVFDSGNSMFYHMGGIPADFGLLDISVNSFYAKEVKLLSQVQNRGLLDIKSLPDSDFVYRLFLKDKFISEKKRLRMIAAYERKIKFLDDFQNGADIWSYDYQKDGKYIAGHRNLQ